MDVLVSYLRMEGQKDIFEDYVTTMLYSIGHVVTVRSGGKWAFPKYRDMLIPKKIDTRTVSEVKADIISKLTNGK